MSIALHLEQLLQRLQEHGLALNADKCEFGKDSIKFLGHQLSQNGFTPLPLKIDAIRRVPLAKTAKELKSFIASINFYRRFIQGATEKQQHLTKLFAGNKKNDKTPIIWTEETIQIFNDCKNQLADSSALAYPIENASLALMSDASDSSVGAVLHQLVGNELQTLGFYSKALTPAQRRYSTYDRELTALFQGIKHFQYLVEGRQFTAYTDHKPLTFALL